MRRNNLQVMVTSLADVVDSDLGSLKDLRGHAFESAHLKIYAEGLIAYLEHDLVGLETAQRALPPATVARLLLKLRRQCREQSIDLSLFDDIENILAESPEWAGEAYFVLSNAAAVLEKHDQSRDYALMAARHLKMMGARRKSVRALLNALASESVLRPKKRYIPDLQHLYQEAKSVADWGSVGTVLLNLAHEYRKLGALRTALRHIDRAVSVQRRHNYGKLDHHFAILNRVQILLDLKLGLEACDALDEITASEFLEVQAGITLLRTQFPGLNRALTTEKIPNPKLILTPTWSERRIRRTLPRLSQSEENLIEILSKKPMKLESLLDKLYGSKIDIECRKNRFFNLLNRLKKKHVGLIQGRNGIYALKERAILAGSRIS